MPRTFEVTLNGDLLENVPYKKKVLKSVILMRAYSAKFDDLYIIPNDINVPEIYG